MPSHVYGEIGRYVASYCTQMLDNLKTDPSPEHDEDEEHENELPPAEPPGTIAISP